MSDHKAYKYNKLMDVMIKKNSTERSKMAISEHGMGSADNISYAELGFKVDNENLRYLG